MKFPRTVYIVFAGSFENSALRARLVLFGESLQKANLRVIFLSQFPGRYLKDTKQDNLLYLSFYRKNSHSLAERLLKVIVGHVRLPLYLAKQVKKRDAIFYYNPTAVTTLPSILLARIINRHLIIDKTELFQHEKNTWYNRLGDNWAFKYATIPFAISDRLMEYGKQHTDKPIVKLPIVVDFERFNPNVKPLAKLIGYVGTSAAKDGLDVVLKGFAKASVQDAALRLRLIGPKPIFFDFDKLVAELGIEDRIELMGSKSFEQIPQLLLACDTFIMNRDDSLFAQFGYPTKLGEYFACKRPVLMSNGPGFSEDFTDKVQAIMYEVNNPKALADAILWRYHNPDEANKIANEGYSFAKQHFSSEVVTSILINTLKEQAILA